MVPVIEQKYLVVHAAAEVPPQQGEHPVLGPDLPGQGALKLRKAHEALEQVDLPVQVAHRSEQRQHRLVAELAEQGPADVVQGPDEPVEEDLPVWGAGKKALDRQLLGVGVDLLQAHQHPAGMAGVGAHPPGGEEGLGQVGLVLKLGGVFPVYIAVKNTAEEPLEGSVIAVNNFHSHKLFSRVLCLRRRLI